MVVGRGPGLDRALEDGQCALGLAGVVEVPAEVVEDRAEPAAYLRVVGRLDLGQGALVDRPRGGRAVDRARPRSPACAARRWPVPRRRASVASRWASAKYGAAPTGSPEELRTRPRSMAMRARACGWSTPLDSTSSSSRAASSKSPARPMALACWVRSTAEATGSVSSSAAPRKCSADAAGSAKSQVSRTFCSRRLGSVIRGLATQPGLVDREPLGLLPLQRRADQPANSGCGRVGRDLSSGWAWVET